MNYLCIYSPIYHLSFHISLYLLSYLSSIYHPSIINLSYIYHLSTYQSICLFIMYLLIPNTFSVSQSYIFCTSSLFCDIDCTSLIILQHYFLFYPSPSFSYLIHQSLTGSSTVFLYLLGTFYFSLMDSFLESKYHFPLASLTASSFLLHSPHEK